MEGPQTRALADHLNELITGRPVERIVVPENRWQANMLLLNCVGQVIQRVRSHGKWLFFDFSHGVTWMCQLITRSKWRVISADEAARKPAPTKKREALITLHLKITRGASGEAAGVVAVLTGHPIFYIVNTDSVRHHPEIKTLGPDPLASATFYEDFPYRLRQNPGRTIAASLLDQEVVAGVGNVMKCEILHAMRFAPALRVGATFASQIDQLAKTIVSLAAVATTNAARSISHHSGGQGFPHRVYDRAGLPCGTCGTEIAVDRSGQDGHNSWYCPVCQSLGQEGTLFTEPA